MILRSFPASALLFGLLGCSPSTRQTPLQNPEVSTASRDAGPAPTPPVGSAADASVEPPDVETTAEVDSGTPSVAANLALAQLSALDDHACARTADGNVACGTSAEIAVSPQGESLRVATAQPTEEVGAGAGHHCVRFADHTVACMGSNSAGQSGQPSSPRVDALTVMPLVRNATQLALGDTHACMLLPTGFVQCWGSIGTTPALLRRQRPKPWEPWFVQGIDSLVQIASGRAHVCGVNRYGIARCWGDDKAGQLGDNKVARSDRPVRVLNVNDATFLTAGTDHTCELERDGTVRCWGDNARGQLGDGSLTARGRAGAVQGVEHATEVNASGRRTCARLESGDVMCWGERTRDATGCVAGTANTVCNTRAVKVDALQGVQHAMPLGTMDCGWSDGTALRCVARP